MLPANDALKPGAVAYFCSACGSADVIVSALSGGEASCNVCHWKGRAEELAAFHFQHGMGSPEEVFRHFFLEMRKLISGPFGQEFGRLLIQWGFLEAPTQKNKAVVMNHLARYCGGIAKAIVLSICKTRSDIDKELRDGVQPS